MRLIDADALHSILADWQLMLSETYGTNDEFVRCLEDVLCTVDNTPTIDAVPVVHGRWKDYPDCGVTVCSACGWSIEECFYDPTTLKPYPYCPKCGARMDGERREG